MDTAGLESMLASVMRIGSTIRSLVAFACPILCSTGQNPLLGTGGQVYPQHRSLFIEDSLLCLRSNYNAAQSEPRLTGRGHPAASKRAAALALAVSRQREIPPADPCSHYL